MTCLLEKHRGFFKKLARLKYDRSELFKFLKKASFGEIKAIAELAYNILRDNVHCSKHRRTKLKIHADTLRFLGDRKKTLSEKKSKLLKGSGVFLSALIPLAISTIATLFKKS